ncbi:cytochrome P450 3A14 [Galendromus occidentalis]|uniref:Cytochrome P450 3A14 n=1 Tax=Galendromus occidentalis TaxID=34638 RepID=A0AAJ6QW23_9ACAR|nr:cytochrome P450 3A14 [Galendromus occidentalis]
MTSMLTGYFVVLIAVLVAVLVKRRRDELRYFKKLGIPGPEPNFFWGHYDKFQENHIHWLEKWAEDYGDFYGIFLGTKPLLVSTDVEFAQYALVMNFSNFVNRAPLLVLQMSNPNIEGFLSLVSGEKWKKLRSLMTPAFTTRNMKEMLPLILRGAEDFIVNLKKQRGPFDIVPLVTSLSIDNMGRTVFGIDVGAQAQKENSSIRDTITKVAESSMTGSLDLLVNSFSTLGYGFKGVFFYLSKLGIIKRPDDDLCAMLKNIIGSRKRAEKSNNLLQRLIDASEDNSTSTTPALSEGELVGNSVGSYFVGVDTTSILLSYLFFCLGQNQDVQDRLREEINRYARDELEYYTVSKLQYLDSVINEVLRLYPPATGFNTRQAAEEFKFRGTTFPAGLNILFAVSSIQRDERHWDEPLEFRPERFEARTNNRLAFQPFGDGPRNCVGMRLALMSTKFVVARALQKFRFRSYGNVERIPLTVLSKPGRVLVSVEPINDDDLGAYRAV